MKPWKKYIIEFLVIVFGILAAIQLEDWNQYLKDRDKEELILREINNEFKNNKEQLTYITSELNQIYQTSVKVRSLFPINMKKQKLDTLFQLLDNKFFFRWTFDPSQGTIRSLINSSNIDLIQNDTLRKLIVSWPDIVSDYQENELIHDRHVENHIEPFFNKKLFFDIEDPRNDFRIFSSKEFENLFHQRSYNLGSILIYSGELQNVMKAIDDIIRLTK